ncbi:hypothetical protein LAJ19_15080 (plasmid) [Deinococcus taeanensis]|uniref:hypothetical protein n=1 Tax=Deinococcus taeanensis TaxID=2737050 RepID=UPI001CDC7CDA|nr:hypothetical protein [Deinococcus taeanensis]UBV44129.1 hypothetical protein LAJ19_15080 [Deinococcus taeanensis]
MARSTAQPPPVPVAAGDWHVYTDGSTRHERRQTVSGWAARAVQPESQQVRQVSGARPGGTSLDAEAEAVFMGLRLVPGGAAARLYSDLDLAALLPLLRSAEGAASWAHLRDLWVQPIARNSGRHHQDMHRVARTAELEARLHRGAPEGAQLANTVLAMQALAPDRQADGPLPLRAPQQLPGATGPLQVKLAGVTFQPAPAEQVQATLTLDLAPVRGTGRTQADAVRAALDAALRPLTRGGSWTWRCTNRGRKRRGEQLTRCSPCRSCLWPKQTRKRLPGEWTLLLACASRPPARRGHGAPCAPPFSARGRPCPVRCRRTCGSRR